MRIARIAVATFGGLAVLAPLSCTVGGSRPPSASDKGAFDAGAIATSQPDAASASDDAGAQMTLDAESDGPQDGAPSASSDGAPVPVQPGSDASMGEPACSLSATWSAPSGVPGVLAFATQPFVTMTSDELTLAWVVEGAQGGSAFVADRVSSSDPFGAPNAITFSGGPSIGIDAAAPPDSGAGIESYIAFDRVGLSADGLTLIGVSVDGSQMAQFIRNARGEAFAAMALPTRYASLGLVLMPGEHLGDPVLSSDGDDLVYSRYGESQTLSIYETFQYGTGAWPPGSPESATSLGIAASVRKRPTCLSSDRRTLFFWDDATNMAYGAFRNGATDQFGSFAKAYGPLMSVQANASCSRLYYVAPASSGFALVHIDAQ